MFESLLQHTIIYAASWIIGKSFYRIKYLAKGFNSFTTSFILHTFCSLFGRLSLSPLLIISAFTNLTTRIMQ